MRDFGPCETSFHEQRRHSSLSQHLSLDRGACGKSIGELAHGLLVARPPFLAGDPCILYALDGSEEKKKASASAVTMLWSRLNEHRRRKQAFLV